MMLQICPIHITHQKGLSLGKSKIWIIHLLRGRENLENILVDIWMLLITLTMRMLFELQCNFKKHPSALILYKIIRQLGLFLPYNLPWFSISFRGDCDNSPKERGDGYRILVSEKPLHKKVHFQHNSKTKRRQGQHIESWDGDRFLIQSMYLNTKHKRGCSPVLKIQFMSPESRKNQNCYNAGK